MAGGELSFEQLTQNVFSPDDETFMEQELQEGVAIEPLWFNTDLILNEFSNIMTGVLMGKTGIGVRNQKMEDLIEKVDVGKEQLLVVSEAASYRVSHAAGSKWYVGINELPQLQGYYDGLSLGPWYDLPVGAEPDIEHRQDFRRKHGIHVRLRNPRIIDSAKGVLEEDLCFVPLNHGHPELGRMVLSDELENPQQ